MVDVLIGFFLATLITELFTTRLFRLIYWYALNSLFLGLIALYVGFNIDDKAMIITGGITLFLKALVIPYILKVYFSKFNIKRQIVPKITIQYSIILIPIVLVFTFYLVTPILNNFDSHANYISIAISSLFLSILLIIEHKNIAPKIVGFLSIENSLFLLGISATDGMPMMIELGIFVDLMMLVVVINLLLKEAK